MIESDYLRENMEVVQKLRQMHTFHGFSDSDLKGLLQFSKIRKYEPGEVIIRQGYFDCWIYFLLKGRLRIVKDEKEISILQRTGDIFGEMGIIDGSPRSASVIAIDSTTCLAADASYIERLSGQDRVAFSSVLYQAFSELLAVRLRTTSDELVAARAEIEGLKARLMEAGVNR